jgi:PKD domain/Prenyltransferase and squalene oxidase repeat
LFLTLQENFHCEYLYANISGKRVTLPASRSVAVLTLLVVLTASSTLSTNSATKGGSSNIQLLPTPSSSLGRALQWLAANQSSDGSYGAYEEHVAAAAAYALWLNDSNSGKAALSYFWLATQLNSSSAWFWGTEADVPGAVLYSIASSHNLPLVNATLVKDQLLQLQNATTGGFEGYSYCSSNCGTANAIYLTVTSSVDTDMALLGLVSSNLIPAQNRILAIQYLLTLQNPDGSSNLTSTKSYDPIYSLGPDSVSITALTLLVLKSDGFTSDNPTISNALKFLSEVAVANFDGNGHVYSAAMSALAFKAYDQPDNAIAAIVYILSQQNSDGGFSDFSRFSYPKSNALDTGWAAIALETQSTEEGPPNPINSPPIPVLSFTPQTPATGVNIHFDASASRDPDTDQLSYVWTFGDGSGAQGVSPTHTYSDAGNFTVTLTVIDSGTNPGPLSATKSLSITIQPTSVQKSSTLPISGSILWILAGTIGGLAIVGIAFYLGRRSARGYIAHSA